MRAVLGDDELRGLGALSALRTALRTLDAVEDADADLRIDVAVVRLKWLRRLAGCSGEVSERPRLPPLLPAMSTMDAVTSAGWE